MKGAGCWRSPDLGVTQTGVWAFTGPAKSSLFEVGSIDFLNVSNKQNSAGNGSQMHFLTQEFLGRQAENNQTTSSGFILALLLDSFSRTIPLTHI